MRTLYAPVLRTEVGKVQGMRRRETEIMIPHHPTVEEKKGITNQL